MQYSRKTGRFLRKHFRLNHLEEMLEAAKLVRDKLKPCKSKEDISLNTDLDHSCGLCCMLDESYVGRKGWCFYDVVSICQESWKHTSGISAFPIKADKKIGTWEGKNLKSRKLLLKHIINCLEGAIKEKSK